MDFKLILLVFNVFLVNILLTDLHPVDCVIHYVRYVTGLQAKTAVIVQQVLF